LFAKEWRDYRLKWNISMYDNICVMYFPSDDLWLPDITLVGIKLSRRK